ncbi:unnamed protein product [Mytilus edulis]|uniref:Uncharacterized protein n=1 Tax=Mytilus edulis TaxID=6550 RepID=A0A8S3Q5N2_MYTED|nr:unnamed protein product [Mytilus edulis]
MNIMAAKDSKKPKSKEDQGKIIMHKKTHDIQNAIFGEAINNPANASITKPGSSMRNPKIKPRAESFATSLPTTIGKASRLDEGRSKSNNKAVQLNGGSTTKISLPVWQSTGNSENQLTTNTTNYISKSKERELDDTRTIEKSTNVAPSLSTIKDKSDTNQNSAISSIYEDRISKKFADTNVSSHTGSVYESYSEDGFRKKKNMEVQTADVSCGTSGASPKNTKRGRRFSETNQY